MSFKTQLTADMDVFFNDDHHAETITYNGSDILAIVDYGEDLDDVKGDTTRIADTITVKASDVDPAYRDTVVIGGNTYTVLRRKSGDGQTWALEIWRGERPVI